MKRGGVGRESPARTEWAGGGSLEKRIAPTCRARRANSPRHPTATTGVSSTQSRRRPHIVYHRILAKPGQGSHLSRDFNWGENHTLAQEPQIPQLHNDRMCERTPPPTTSSPIASLLDAAILGGRSIRGRAEIRLSIPARRIPPSVQRKSGWRDAFSPAGLSVLQAEGREREPYHCNRPNSSVQGFAHISQEMRRQGRDASGV